MSEHTKGPWKSIAWEGRMEIRSEDNSETGIAFLGRTEDGIIPSAKTRANAHLITASPKLLHACWLALNIMEQCIDYESMPVADAEIIENKRSIISNIINEAKGK